MASEPLLDFNELLEPISGDNEAGDPLPFDVRMQLKEDRREEDPDRFSPDDPMRPEKPKRADWPAITRRCTEILEGTSKDLLVAAYLTEALTKQHGFAGARDGLRLLAQMVDQCWERLNPAIEDGDIEPRATPFTWLDGLTSGALFPSTLKQLPLIQAPEGKFGWFEWKAYQDGKLPIPKEDFDKAVNNTPVQFSQDRLDEITQALAELHTLNTSLDAKMGPLAPGLTNVGQALEGCRLVAKSMVENKGGVPAPPAPTATTSDLGAPQADGAAGGTGRPAASRAEAYRQLEQAASLLQQLEPHSPVPYLVRKAVELGGLPFPELMRRLIRDGNVLLELSRELGIKDETPPSDGSSE